MKRISIRRATAALSAALLALGLFGCGKAAKESPETAPTTTVPWVAEAPQVPDVSKLLTAAEVSETLGVMVGDAVLQEGDTMLAFHSADYQSTLTVLVEQVDGGAGERFAAVLNNYAPEDLVMAPNLGNEAYWCGETGELLVHSGNYMLSVCLTRPGFSGDNALIAARHLAALAVERLPA